MTNSQIKLAVRAIERGGDVSVTRTSGPGRKTKFLVTFRNFFGQPDQRWLSEEAAADLGEPWGAIS